jgi:2-methylaconitate cis-trans-isomerase PrpF
MGGGISSLSKICVVGSPSSEQKTKDGIDAEYTFVQVGIRDSTIDYSGNCGNLSSMIGVFAVDEGICRPRVTNGGLGTVQTFNTNTNKRIHTTFPIASSGNEFVPVLDLEETSMAGVPGKASRITLDFVSPAGARTGQLLPSGNPIDVIHGINSTSSIHASLVDATNPTVFISSSDLRQLVTVPPSSSLDFTAPSILSTLEIIRQKGAEIMGLDPSTQAQPKIAILTPSSNPDIDILVHAMSMGVLHKAVPMTVGLCLGVAANVKGSLPWEIARMSGRRAKGGLVRIQHPGGIVEVGAEFGENGEVKSAKVVRTGRRLMKGVIWW